jgi:hypothetical protein
MKKEWIAARTNDLNAMALGGGFFPTYVLPEHARNDSLLATDKPLPPLVYVHEHRIAQLRFQLDVMMLRGVRPVHQARLRLQIAELARAQLLMPKVRRFAAPC